MIGRSIDRELGLPEANGGHPGRESWLSDWPLLLGLVLSAALIAGSIVIGGSGAKPAAAQPKKNNPAAAVSGEVVDVGEPEPVPKAEARPAQKQKAKRTKKAAATGDDGATADSTGRSAAPAESSSSSSSGGSSGSPSTTKRSTGSTGGTGSNGGGSPKPGRIVNVTGTSAAFSNGPMAYAFNAPTHTPTVGKRWRLQVSVKRSGRPLAGNVKIDILHDGSVVGHAAKGALDGGRFAHDFDWPEQSVGHPLTVKTTVVGGGFQQSFLFNVKVRGAG